jgi:hypothetical protein
MPSSYSSNLKIELIATGEQDTTWGSTTNTNLGTALEQAITGTGSVVFASADVTLAFASSNASQDFRNIRLVLSGTTAGPRNLVVPNIQKLYLIDNTTADTVTVTTAAGTGVAVPSGAKSIVYANGVDVVQGINHINSPSFTGTPTAPTAALSTNTTQIATTAFVLANQTPLVTILQTVYPVGSIYINASVTTNPATLLGFGTWVEFGSGRVLVSQDTGDASFDNLEETGGSKDAIVVSHTHTGSTNTTGSHNHSYINPKLPSGGSNSYQNGPQGTTWRTENISTDVTGTNGDHSHTFTTASTGSSGTNANLQPYIVVKMWKRTA